VSYESLYEKFRVVGPEGRASEAVFKKAGFLAAGDHPELYFFELDAQRVVVQVSGTALTNWQRSCRYLTREEKIDVAGLWLKQRVASGTELSPENLYLQEAQLDEMVRALGLTVRCT
jgi:hypothetical protein